MKSVSKLMFTVSVRMFRKQKSMLHRSTLKSTDSTNGRRDVYVYMVYDRLLEWKNGKLNTIEMWNKELFRVYLGIYVSAELCVFTID